MKGVICDQLEHSHHKQQKIILSKLMQDINGLLTSVNTMF